MVIKNVISAISIFTVVGLSMATSVFGFGKVSSQLRKPLTEHIVVPELKGTSSVEANVEEKSKLSTNVSANKVSGSEQIKTTTNTKVSLQNTTPTPKSVTTSSPTPTPTPPSVNKCIITLFGLQYDVTSLMNTHSGGNVFVCGTDMTAVYQGQHGTNVSRMAAYLVTSTSPAPSSSPSPITH